MIQPAPSVAPALRATRAAVERGIEEGLHSGAQVYVSQAGAVVGDVAIGEARPGGPPMTPDTLMPWLCCTKLPVTVALAQLEEAGRVAFDHPLSRYVPEFSGAGRDAVTLEHVLTHTAGLAPEGLVAAVGGDTWEETLMRVCAEEPHAPPGELALYSVASGWHLLGEVIRRVSGRPLEEHLEAAVFAPLGMDGSHVGMSRERYRELSDRLGALHWATDGRLVAEPLLTDEQVLCRCVPGSTGVGPIRELARLLERLLLARRAPDESPLRPETVERITRPRRTEMNDEIYGGTFDWGLGLTVDGRAFASVCSRGTFGHTGQETSWAFADPDREVVVAAVLNGLAGERSVMRREELVVAIYEDLGLIEPGTMRRRRAAWAAARKQRFRTSTYVQRSGGRAAWAHLLDGVPAATEALIESCFELMCAAADPPRDATGTVAYELPHGGATLRLSLVLADGRVALERGRATAPDLTLRLSVADFVRWSLGELTSETAFRSGRARAAGDLRLLDRVRYMCRAGGAEAEPRVPLPGVPAF